MFSRMTPWLTLLLAAGCAMPQPTTRPDQPSGVSDRDSGPPKAITIAQLNPTKSYGPWDFSSTSGGGPSLAEVHTVSLVSEDQAGNPAARLAARIPSLDDGTMTLLPDGRMRTLWSLRPGILWHDGTPFTADDVVFSWQVARQPELLSTISTLVRLMESVEVLDPLTVSITWKTTSNRALDLGHRNLWPFPKHLLAEGLEGDKLAFLALPYFSTAYVNLGPFRLIEFAQGERQVFERFDGYFLGRPKLSRIILQAISDPSALLVNLHAGTVDIAAEKLFPSDTYVQIRDEWRRTGDGLLLERQDNWPYVRFQFDAQWARPIEMSRDVRIRRGLLFGIDRDSLRETVLPGFANTSGDTFMVARDPRGAIVGQPYAQYRYDPARALQEFAEAGWTRGPDGRLLGRDREQVQFEVRGENQNYEKEVPILANWWRQLGIATTEFIPPISLARDREYRATFPSVETTSRGRSEDIFISFDGRLHSTAQNRWQGSNISHYANPALDALIDKLEGTLEQEGQGQILKEMGEIMASDLPVLPLYFRPSFVAVRRGIHAMKDDYAGTQGVGAVARYAHLWDRD